MEAHSSDNHLRNYAHSREVDAYFEITEFGYLGHLGRDVARWRYHRSTAPLCHFCHDLSLR